MSDRRCLECRKWLDGLTDDAEPHPLYDRYCVGCGDAIVANDSKLGVAHTMADQERREHMLRLQGEL